MVFKSLLKERNSLKLKIYTLECIKEAKGKPLEYWLAAAKEGLRSIHFEKQENYYEKDDAKKEFLETLEKLVAQVEELKERKENRNQITALRNQAEALIVKTLDKYRGELAVKDAILLKEPTEFEDKISHMIDSYFFKSRFFKIQVWILLAVVAFAGLGSWQLYSGAKSAGDMVNDMNIRVTNAYERIEKITGNLEGLLTGKAEEKIDEIKAKVEKNVTDEVKKNALTRIDSVFKETPAEQQIATLIKEMVEPHVEKTTIDEKVGVEIKKDVANRVKTIFQNTPVDQRVKPVLKGMLESKVNELNIDATVRTVAQEAVTERIDGLFNKTPVEQQVEAILKGEVESEISQIDIQNKFGNIIEKDVTSKIKDVLRKTPLERQVQAVIDNWVRTSATQMQSLENRIESLEQRVLKVSKDVKFSILNIWDYSDWFLKGSIVLLYLLFLSLIVFGGIKGVLYIFR